MDINNNINRGELNEFKKKKIRGKKEKKRKRIGTRPYMPQASRHVNVIQP